MENLARPGTCNINAATIITSKGQQLDITALILSLNIYEDMASPFVTGTISLTDANAMSEALPFMGEELLTIDLETPYLTAAENPLARLKKEFYIYKMTERENVNVKNVVYTLHFVSVEAFLDINSRISQTFRGNISDNVSKLLEKPPGLQTNKKTIVEKTTNTAVHTSNFWTPTQNIYFLTRNALNTLANPSFVFFENNEGFIFMSLDTLMSAQPYAAFTRSQKMKEPKESYNLDEEYGKILDVSTPNMYDYFDRVENGFYGGSVYHYDVESKRLNFKNVLAKQDLKKGQLNKEVAVANELPFIPSANQQLSIINRNLYVGYNNLAVDHTVRRMALLKQLSATTINIQVYGRLDYSVGRVVNLTFFKDGPTDKGMTDEEILDNVLSGNYLITALSHEITQDQHVCNIELSKDSMNKSIIRQ
jgi:hypothetical protein